MFFSIRGRKERGGDGKERRAEDAAQVKLKSLFGLHPFLSFVIKLLLVALAICVIPSFFTSSKRLYISSDPYPLRVELDSRPMGITPCNFKVSPGKHVLDFLYADEVVCSKTVTIRPALFLSYIFEYSENVFAKTALSDDLKETAIKNFMQDCVDYQTLFVTDSTHIQKPHFSQLRSLLADEAPQRMVRAGSMLIANSSAANDFSQSFPAVASPILSVDFPESRIAAGKDFALLISDDAGENGTQAMEFCGEVEIAGRRFIDAGSVLVSKGLVDAELFGMFLSERADGLSLQSQTGETERGWDFVPYGKDAGVRAVSFEMAEEFMMWFSARFSCRARLLSKPEYVRAYRIKECFDDFTSGPYELTATPFITYESLSLKRLESAEREEICECFKDAGVEMARELFCLGDYNAGVSDDIRLALTGVIFPLDRYETVGFRIAVEK